MFSNISWISMPTYSAPEVLQSWLYNTFYMFPYFNLSAFSFDLRFRFVSVYLFSINVTALYLDNYVSLMVSRSSANNILMFSMISVIVLSSYQSILLTCSTSIRKTRSSNSTENLHTDKMNSTQHSLLLQHLKEVLLFLEQILENHTPFHHAAWKRSFRHNEPPGWNWFWYRLHHRYKRIA